MNAALLSYGDLRNNNFDFETLKHSLYCHCKCILKAAILSHMKIAERKFDLPVLK